MIGTQLGHYRIERLLGSGGMGEVYVADDLKLGRRVALKILSTELTGDPNRRERFEREARAAAALNHPNIVTIHSVEEVDGIPFLTLELLDGKTLNEIIPAQGLPLDRLLTLAIPLTDAVGAAHQAGITHRDLKPANVMITADGRVKVLDFGLAKVREEAQANAETLMPTAALTGEGRIVGTVMYMSPEQAEGKPVDQRSDVFSLGIILYEMATGVRPFAGDTQMSILSAIMKDTPKPITEARVGLPRELSKIVSRCLAKDPEDRYQAAKDLRNDLRALKNELTSGEIVPLTASGVAAAPPVPRAPTRSRVFVLVVVATLVVAAVVGGFLWSNRTVNSTTSAARPFDSINLSRLTTIGHRWPCRDVTRRPLCRTRVDKGRQAESLVTPGGDHQQRRDRSSRRSSLRRRELFPGRQSHLLRCIRTRLQSRQHVQGAGARRRRAADRRRR